MGVRPLLAVGLASLLAFAATTLWALESGGVAVVETRAGEGARRTTRIWYVEDAGSLWLEAGTPENPWFRDVRRDPVLRLERGGRATRYRAHPVLGPEGAQGHERIRTLMRVKYGLRDRWVGLLFDTSRSVAVRLEPESE